VCSVGIQLDCGRSRDVTEGALRSGLEFVFFCQLFLEREWEKFICRFVMDGAFLLMLDL
jgi:hypothetical protein